MSEINCTVNQNAPAASPGPLTVGSVFELRCPSSAEQWQGISPEHAELKLAEADKYKLKLLKLDFVSPNEARLTVTSYQPGTHQLVGVQVVDAQAAGGTTVTLAPLNFAVVSVLDPQKPETEPYGPLGPVKLSLPFWYWLIVAGVIFFFAGIVGYRFWRRQRKRKLLAKMQVLESAQTPYFQFHQSIRRLQREIGFATTAENPSLAKAMQELASAYQIYLARTFLIPTLYWTERQIRADLKKNYRSLYEEHRADFKKSLAELSRARAALKTTPASLANKDIEQILKLLRDHVDRVEQSVREQKTKKIFGGFG
jgi:hypothetical protein